MLVPDRAAQDKGLITPGTPHQCAVAVRGGAEGLRIELIPLAAEEETRAPAYGAYAHMQAYHGSDWVATQEAKPKVERPPATRAPNAAEQVTHITGCHVWHMRSLAGRVLRAPSRVGVWRAWLELLAAPPSVQRLKGLCAQWCVCGERYAASPHKKRRLEACLGMLWVEAAP